MTLTVSLTVVTIYSNQLLTGHASFHISTIVSAIGASVLQVHVWNSLPSYLRQDVNYEQFKQQLKTLLFNSLLITAECD